MAVVDIQDYVRLLPAVNRTPHHAIWLTYDTEADTLYVNYKKPSYATDGKMMSSSAMRVTRSLDSPYCTRADERRRSPPMSNREDQA